MLPYPQEIRATSRGTSNSSSEYHIRTRCMLLQEIHRDWLIRRYYRRSRLSQIIPMMSCLGFVLQWRLHGHAWARVSSHMGLVSGESLVPSWRRHICHYCTRDIFGGQGGLVDEEVEQEKEVDERLSDTRSSSLLLFCCSTIVRTLFQTLLLHFGSRLYNIFDIYCYFIFDTPNISLLLFCTSFFFIFSIVHYTSYEHKYTTYSKK